MVVVGYSATIFLNKTCCPLGHYGLTQQFQSTARQQRFVETSLSFYTIMIKLENDPVNIYRFWTMNLVI